MKKENKGYLLAFLGVVLVVGGLWYFGTDWMGSGGNGKALDIGGAGTTTTTTQQQSASQQLAGTCTVPLAKAQVLSIGAFDADRTATAVSGIGTVVLSNEQTGATLSGNTTTPGMTYTILASKSGSLKGYKQITTTCTETDPQVVLKMETYDSAPTVTVYNVGGRTPNVVNTANQTLTAGSPATFQIEVQPSALYKHLAGGVPEGQTGKFAVFYNYTNSSDWDPSGFALSTYGAWGSVACEPYNGIMPVYSGVVMKGFTCSADFTGKDSAIYGLYATVKPSSIYANGPKAVLTVTIVPVDYYQNTITGVLSTGPVKDDGSAIQTGIQKGIGLA